MCQEMGHVFGLDHQYIPACMDDINGINDPRTPPPASHDYAHLDTIYGSHLDAAATRSSSAESVSVERTPDTR